METAADCQRRYVSCNCCHVIAPKMDLSQHSMLAGCVCVFVVIAAVQWRVPARVLLSGGVYERDCVCMCPWHLESDVSVLSCRVYDVPECDDGVLQLRWYVTDGVSDGLVLSRWWYRGMPCWFIRELDCVGVTELLRVVQVRLRSLPCNDDIMCVFVCLMA